MNPIIEVTGVAKAFGSQTVLRDVNFKVKHRRNYRIVWTEWSWKDHLSSDFEWSHKT